MKKIHILALCAVVALESGQISAQSELPEPIRIFGESAGLMMTGIASHNRDDLSDAAEMLGSLKCSNMDEYDIEERNPGDLTPPEVVFTDSYCDFIKKSNFEIVAINDLDFMRSSAKPNLLLVSQGIRAGGEVTFTFLGAADMALGIAASAPSTLRYSLIYGSQQIDVKTDDTGYFNSAIWQMEDDDEPFSITISNPSDKTVSFSIALEG